MRLKVPIGDFDRPVDRLDAARGLLVGLSLAVLLWTGFLLWLLW
jgi:hypothetical protein